MAKRYQMDYGVRVKILRGKFAGREGIVVMGSRFGDVGINLRKKPQSGEYQTREKPEDLEVVSTEDNFGIKNSAGDCFSMFDCWKMNTVIFEPQEVLNNQQYFSEVFLELARMDKEYEEEKRQALVPS